MFIVRLILISILFLLLNDGVYAQEDTKAIKNVQNENVQEQVANTEESEEQNLDNSQAVAGGPASAKKLSGISIIGNKDAPKSLYIVPWRGSELELETDLNSSLLNEGFHAVDKDVFIRELSFYESIADK